MKKFLPLIIVLVSFAQAYSQQSQLLISENFTGYSNANLNGQGSWTATGNANYVQVANATPLTYPNYASGTQYANLVQKDDYNPNKHPDDPYKNFIANTTIATNTSNPVFYISFLVNVPSTVGTASTNSATPSLSLRTSTGGSIADFYIADNGSTGVKFGISKNGAGDGTYSSASGTTYAANTTHLIVIRYDIYNGSGFGVSSYDDKMYMWVDPSLTSEPSIASAQVNISNFWDFNADGSSGNISGLQLYQEQYSATASLDAFKVAYAKSFSTTASTSLAAWNALSPIAAPLPVTFGELNGYAKDNGIKVDWSIYTELNVNHYEIERSTDGVSFSKVGSVIAQNAEGTLYYNWFDATPSAGNNFYRIKNVDNDGKSTYSAVIKVSLSKATGSALTVYPNPATGSHVSFQVNDLPKGDYKIEIINMAGQQVYNKQLNHAGGALSQGLQLPSGIKTGIYNIRVTNNSYTQAKQFLVQ